MMQQYFSLCTSVLLKSRSWGNLETKPATSDGLEIVPSSSRILPYAQLATFNHKGAEEGVRDMHYLPKSWWLRVSLIKV